MGIFEDGPRSKAAVELHALLSHNIARFVYSMRWYAKTGSFSLASSGSMTLSLLGSFLLIVQIWFCQLPKVLLKE